MVVGRFWYQLFANSDIISREYEALEADQPKSLERMIRYDDAWGVVLQASRKFCEISAESAHLRMLNSLREDSFRFDNGHSRFDHFIIGMYQADPDNSDQIFNFLSDMSAHGLHGFAHSLESNESLLRAVVEKLITVDKTMAADLTKLDDFPSVMAMARSCLGLPNIDKAGKNEPVDEPNLVDELKRDLLSDDEDRRNAAMAMLIKGGEEALPELCAALTDRDKKHSLQVRQRVARALVKIGDSQGIETVRHALNTSMAELERRLASQGKVDLEWALSTPEWIERAENHHTVTLARFCEELTNALQDSVSTLEKSAQRSLWIFDRRGSVVGLWVCPEYAGNENLYAIVRMLYASMAQLAEKNDKEMSELGFSDRLMTDIYEQRMRTVANHRMEISGGSIIAGGAFLMTGDARAPNEYKQTQDSFEVRETAHVAGLIQIGD